MKCLVCGEDAVYSYNLNTAEHTWVLKDLLEKAKEYWTKFGRKIPCSPSVGVRKSPSRYTKDFTDPAQPPFSACYGQARGDVQDQLL